MTDPNTPTTSSINPQDLINQALGSSSTPTPLPETEPATQTLPTSEPLTPSEPSTNNLNSTPTATMPLADSNPTPTPLVESVVPEALNVEPKGEDVPLSLLGAEPIVNSNSSIPNAEPVATAPVVPIAPSTSQGDQAQDGKKKKSKIATAVFVGLLALMGVVSLGGYYAYQRYGTASPGTIAQISTYTKEQCQGCSRPQDGGWLVWRDGQCKVSGTCNSTVNNNQNTTNPNADTLNEADCKNAGKGYVWCSATDMLGVSYGFCNTTGVDGVAAKTCQNLAAEKGYVVLTGSYSGQCERAADGTWTLTEESRKDFEPYAEYRDSSGKSPLEKAEQLCRDGDGTLDFGNAKYICKVGEVGSGGQVYNGGACTEANGYPYKSNTIGCICGTVQIDYTDPETGIGGHTSYTSTCGCDKETTSSPSPSPTASLMCTSLTRTPNTAPKIGDSFTFSCAGSVVPAEAAKLSYSYRYQINGGAWQQMLTDRSSNPAARLTIDTCGTYKVQCRVCGQIGGKQVCDPNWVAATQ